MKSLIIGVLAIGAALPALAEPNWQIIEQGRKAKAMQAKGMATPQEQASGAGSAGASQSSREHAQMEQMMKECMEMMKKN